jgi:hypothetical protein
VSGLHRIAGAATLLLCCACARPTEVELRLRACALAGEVPVKVDLEIRGLDAANRPLPVLRASYPIEPEALTDGYATVGLVKPEGMVEADFTVTWYDGRGGVEVVELLQRPVPAAGQVLELGAERCLPLDPGTSSSSGSSGADTSTGSSSTTDASSSSSGDDTSTGTTAHTSTTGDTSTGDATSSTGDTDPSTGGTTGESTLEGMPCNFPVEQFHCEHGGPGQVGTMLNCVNNKWKADLEEVCKSLLQFNCPDTLGLVDPVVVGCSGVGPDGLTCVCKDMAPQPCQQTGCGPDETITLCDGEERAQAVCSNYCEMFDGQPMCVAEML